MIPLCEIVKFEHEIHVSKYMVQCVWYYEFVTITRKSHSCLQVLGK